MELVIKILFFFFFFPVKKCQLLKKILKTDILWLEIVQVFMRDED